MPDLISNIFHRAQTFATCEMLTSLLAGLPQKTGKQQTVAYPILEQAQEVFNRDCDHVFTHFHCSFPVKRSQKPGMCLESTMLLCVASPQERHLYSTVESSSTVQNCDSILLAKAGLQELDFT